MIRYFTQFKKNPTEVVQMPHCVFFMRIFPAGLVLLGTIIFRRSSVPVHILLVVWAVLVKHSVEMKLFSVHGVVSVCVCVAYIVIVCKVIFMWQTTMFKVLLVEMHVSCG